MSEKKLGQWETITMPTDTKQNLMHLLEIYAKAYREHLQMSTASLLSCIHNLFKDTPETTFEISSTYWHTLTQLANLYPDLQAELRSVHLKL